MTKTFSLFPCKFNSLSTSFRNKVSCDSALRKKNISEVMSTHFDWENLLPQEITVLL